MYAYTVCVCSPYVCDSPFSAIYLLSYVNALAIVTFAVSIAHILMTPFILSLAFFFV